MKLQQHHTFGFDYHANDVIYLEEPLQCQGLPASNDYYVLGEGSNTIFTEDLSVPLVINQIKGIDIIPNNTGYSVEVGAGENWHNLVMLLLDKEVLGLENLVLIPGTVGAAPIQNIGAYGVEVGRFIHSVRVFDRCTQQHAELTNLECLFSYRDSIFKHYPKRYIVTSVRFELPNRTNWSAVLNYGELKDMPADVSARAVAERVIQIRQQKLPNPNLTPNSGSFFKNPVVTTLKAQELQLEYPNMPVYSASEGMKKIAAGWLIEQCGLKGYTFNGLQIHPHQALVITRITKSNGEALKQFVKMIHMSVLKRFGVKLEVEVRVINAKGEALL